MDVDDLIREADELLAAIDGGRGSRMEGAPDLVRLLRDALEASHADLTEMSEEFIQEWVDHRKSRQDLTEARAALAEANATIARIEALHVQVRVCTDVRTGVWRWECGTCGEAGDGGEWPCDTTKAIEGER